MTTRHLFLLPAACIAASLAIAAGCAGAHDDATASIASESALTAGETIAAIGGSYQAHPDAEVLGGELVSVSFVLDLDKQCHFEAITVGVDCVGGDPEATCTARDVMDDPANRGSVEGTCFLGSNHVLTLDFGNAVTERYYVTPEPDALSLVRIDDSGKLERAERYYRTPGEASLERQVKIAIDFKSADLRLTKEIDMRDRDLAPGARIARDEARAFAEKTAEEAPRGYELGLIHLYAILDPAAHDKVIGYAWRLTGEMPNSPYGWDFGEGWITGYDTFGQKVIAWDDVWDL